MFPAWRILPKLKPCVRTFSTRNAQILSPTRRILKYTRDVLKTNVLVMYTPIKSFGYLGVAYGTFCVGFSLLFPREWHLSDHNVLLTGIVRVFRTVFNAALIFAVYKYTYWGVINPNQTENSERPDYQFRSSKAENGEDDLTPEEKEYHEIRNEFWEFASNRIANVMLTNGGTYIKVGQGMATFSAMLPPQFATALKPLLSNVFERLSGEVDHMFVKDLGKKPEDLYAEFQREPIAGASIAQVFVAKTHDGKKVAVKVQYFDISKRFKMDKGTVMFLLGVLDWFVPGVPFLKIMPHVFDSLQKEMDFVNEGRNSELCKNELQNLNFAIVPIVHWSLTSKRILTMDFAEGINLIDAEKVIAAGFNTKEIMTKIIRIFSEQIFRTGNIHSDPHPGNLMVRKNAITGKMEIVVIDHGLYEHLPFEYRQAFASFWQSVIIDDYDEVQRSGNVLGLSFPDMMATLLFFKPYGKMKEMGFGGMHGERRKKEDITEEEKGRMEAVRNMGHDTIDSLPKELALVFRNIRLIQGINLSFEVPVNRVRLMAEVAVRNCKKNEDFMTALRSRAKFEWHFFVLDIRNMILSWSLWIYSYFAEQKEGTINISNAALFLKA